VSRIPLRDGFGNAWLDRGLVRNISLSLLDRRNRKTIAFVVHQNLLLQNGGFGVRIYPSSAMKPAVKGTDQRFRVYLSQKHSTVHEL
jgi:hypothetical protein